MAPLPVGEARTRLVRILCGVFALAMILGPGPGLYLVNPDPSDPDAVFTWGGVPVVYVWALWWFAVQAGVVLIAYRWLWQAEDAASAEGQA